MNKEEIINDFINYLNRDIQNKDFLTYLEQEEWKDYINRIINNQVKEKDKEIERLNNICKRAVEYIKHSQSYGTMAQVMPHLKPYVNGDDLLDILGGDEG